MTSIWTLIDVVSSDAPIVTIAQASYIPRIVSQWFLDVEVHCISLRRVQSVHCESPTASFCSFFFGAFEINVLFFYRFAAKARSGQLLKRIVSPASLARAETEEREGVRETNGKDLEKSGKKWPNGQALNRQPNSNRISVNATIISNRSRLNERRRRGRETPRSWYFVTVLHPNGVSVSQSMLEINRVQRRNPRNVNYLLDEQIIPIHYSRWSWERIIRNANTFI